MWISSKREVTVDFVQHGAFSKLIKVKCRNIAFEAKIIGFVNAALLH